MTADLLGATSYTVDSLSIVELGVLGLLSRLLCHRWDHRRTMVMGAGFLSVGMALLLYSLWPHVTGLFFAGSAVLSFG